MLVVPTLELSHPIVLYVLVEAHDVSVNSVHTSRLRINRPTISRLVES